MRKSAKVHEIAEFFQTGRRALVAARLRPDQIARRRPARNALPQFHPPRAICRQPVGLDHPLQPDRAAIQHPQAPALEPAVGKARHRGKGERHPVAHRHRLHLGGKTRQVQVHPTGAIAQHRRAMAVIDPALHLVQPFRKAAQFGMKGPARPRDLAQAAAKHQHPLRHGFPVHQPALHLGAVIAPGLDIRLGDRQRRQRPHRLAIVHRQAGGLLQGLGGQPAISLEADPGKAQIAVMVGKAQHKAIAPRHCPGPANRGGAGRQMVQKLLLAHQTRTSTTGTLGASPA